MFRHVVRYRLRQANKLGSHSAPACSTASNSLRAISVTAGQRSPRAYDKIRALNDRQGAEGQAGRQVAEGKGFQSEVEVIETPTGKNNLKTIKMANSTVEGNAKSTGSIDYNPSGLSRIKSLPNDFGEKYLTSPSPPPPNPNDDPNAGTDPSVSFYETQLKNQLLASFLPVNQRATPDPIVAIVCPIEGGEYIVRQTVERAAGLVNADVVRVESIECLGLRQYGNLGQGKSGESLHLGSNPLLLSEESTAASQDPEEPQLVAIEDEGEDGEHGGITIGQPIEISLPMLGGPAFQPSMSPLPTQAALGEQYVRQMNKGKVEKLMSDIVNVTDKRSHTAPESSSQGAQVRPRIIYIQDAVAMASTFEDWFPALLKAVRARRQTGVDGKEVQHTVTRPTTIVLGCTPSLLHTSVNLRAKKNSEALASAAETDSPVTNDRPPIPPALANFLSSLRSGGKQGNGGSSNEAEELWKGSEEDDVLGRKTRLKRRLRRFRLSDERELRALLPEFGDASETQEDRPVAGPRLMDLSAVINGGGIGRGRHRRGNPEILDAAINRDSARPWKVLGTLPLKRDVTRERRERQQQRLRVNSLLLRKAIGLQGGTMTSEDMASELGSDDPKIDISIHQELTDIRDSFADAIWPWLTIQHLASIAIGHSLSSRPSSKETVDTGVPITWRAIAEASIHEEAGESQAADFIANYGASAKDKTNSNSHQGKSEVEPVRDPVIEAIKRDKSLNTHEKRLLGCIVDPTKLSSTSFEDVYLPEKTIDAVRSVVTLPLIYPDAFNTGILAQHATGNALLFGPPGTGKTLLARALARESGARMIAVQPSDVTDMYVGEGEKLVKAVFSLARRMSPCIVFLDEVDSLFGARSGQSSGGAQAHRQILTEFMQEMDGLSSASKNREQRIVVIGATNRPYDLDEAVLRRLPRRLLVDLPGAREREAILRILLKNEKLAEDVDLQKIAEETDTYSGSDLKHLCVSAALASLKETVHLPWKSGSSTWTPSPPGYNASVGSGPANAYARAMPDAEIQEPEIPSPDEIVPQPQMQRLQALAPKDEWNDAAWDQTSFLTALQEVFGSYATPMQVHGMLSRDANLVSEQRLFSRRSRLDEHNEALLSAPVVSQQQEIHFSPLSPRSISHITTQRKRQRSSHVDGLLQSPTYAGLNPPLDILTLLRERRYRGAAFYFLSQEQLRADHRLISLLQEAIYLDLRGLNAGKPHDLAIRLGWTYPGAKRGPAREALHQKLVVQQGRLPSIKEIQRAISQDSFDPHDMSGSTVRHRSAVTTPQLPVSRTDSTSSDRPRDWTLHYNQQLHNQVLEGAVAKQIRKDGQKHTRHARPGPGLHQLSTLLRKIQELKADRGFQPDWVTVNLVVKAWLRGLAAGPQKSPYGVGEIFHAFKNVLTMDAIKKHNVDYDRIVQPLGKMLVKAMKSNGEWLKAREVLAWMSEIRQASTEYAELVEAGANGPAVAKSKHSGLSAKIQDGKVSGLYTHTSSPDGTAVPGEEEMERQSSPSPTRERIISMKHFKIAMQEITPSSSESGNLPELRKWASQYGEGGTERGKKSGYGSKFGFGDDKGSQKETGYGRVRPEEDSI